MASMDNPTNVSHSSRCKRLNQHVGAFVASIGGFALGSAIGWHSSASGIVKNTMENSTLTEINLMTSGFYIGATCGSLFVPLILKILTHITTMYITIPFFVIGWAFICMAEQKMTGLIIGRLILGMCGSVHSVITPLYVSEIADKDIRGRLLSFHHLLVSCGVLYAYLVAHIIDEEESVFRYSLMCGLPCIAISIVVFLPESPIRLLSKPDECTAYQSVQWYKGKNRLAEELKQLQKFIFAKSSPRKLSKLLTNGQVLRSLFVCFCVMITQQLSGINVIIPNALMVFNVGGSGDMSGSQQTVVVGGVQIVSCILATTLVDIVGRRILVTVSSIMMGLFLILLGWYYDVREEDIEFEENFYWMPPTLIVLLFAAFNAGIGPISWSLLGDSFPEEMKVTAASIFAAFNWLTSLLAMIYCSEMYLSLGVAKTMFLFAIFCWVGSILLAIFLRNTHRKSLTEIQKWFGPNEPPSVSEDVPPVPTNLYRTEPELTRNV